MNKLITFKNLDDLSKYFSTEAKCVKYFEQARWNGQRVLVAGLSKPKKKKISLPRVNK